MSTATPILIVDDTPENLAVLSEALTSAGFRVAVAIDGESAIEQVNYRQPALILLDVMMPGMSGFEVCQRLQMSPDTRDIPIIFMTALADTDHKVQGLSLGAVDYITKPFQQKEVLARVRIHLQLRNVTKTLEIQNHLLKQEIEQRQQAEALLQVTNQQLEQKAAELLQALDKLEQAQVTIVQQEKLSALGELVAGVAHEINNPINFIASNIQPAQNHITDICEVLALYRQSHPEPTETIQDALEEIDLDFAIADLPNILKSMDIGVQRIDDISSSLRNFARSDMSKKLPLDLTQSLDGILLILGHRLKACGGRPKIEIVKYYSDLPLVECYRGQLSQVFMNLLANAIDAIEDALAQQKMTTPQIRLQTQQIDDWVQICISDNGIGMSEEVKQRAFEHLFTTKGIGKGTGLGLAIARQIVVERHTGIITIDSQVGQGTTFTVQLPTIAD